MTGLNPFLVYFVGGFWLTGILDVSLIVLAYFAFYLYRQVVTGSITACFLCSVACGLALASLVVIEIKDILAFLPILVSPSESFNIDVPWVSGISDAARDWINDSK